jgi:hypothetical protein
MTICNGSLDLISRTFCIFNLYLKKCSNKLSKYPKITEFLKYEFNYCLTCVPTMVSSNDHLFCKTYLSFGGVIYVLWNGHYVSRLD